VNNDDGTRLPIPTDDGNSNDQLIADLRRIIADGRGRAAAAVNAEIVATYWSVGERIVREEQGGAERAAYGAGLLARLGRILSRDYGRGFTETSLQNMRRFYLAYPISSALRRELTWTHYRVLMRLEEGPRSLYTTTLGSAYRPATEVAWQTTTTKVVWGQGVVVDSQTWPSSGKICPSMRHFSVRGLPCDFSRRPLCCTVTASHRGAPAPRAYDARRASCR